MLYIHKNGIMILLAFYEKVALRTAKLGGIFMIIAIIGFSVLLFEAFIFKFLSFNMYFFILQMTMWLFGIALIRHMYKPQPIINANGEKIYIGKMRLESEGMQKYQTVSMTIWFSFQILFTFFYLINCF